MNEFIIRKTYIKLMIVQIFGIVISAANSSIDAMITGIFLGQNILAAKGLFAPVATVIGLSYVIIIGLQILCSRAVGSGESQKVVSMFSAGAVFLAVCGAAVSVLCLLFSEPLSLILQGGTESSAGVPLREYIHGYSYGIVFQVLSAMLMVFLPLNNSVNLSYVSIIVMLVSNIAMDMLSIALGLGAFGIGIATSISYLFSFMSMLYPFVEELHNELNANAESRQCRCRSNERSGEYMLCYGSYTYGLRKRLYVSGEPLLRRRGQNFSAGSHEIRHEVRCNSVLCIYGTCYGIFILYF